MVADQRHSRNSKLDMKADMQAVDREELVTLMEPLVLGERFRHRARIA